jgi:hypothetical protein
MELFMKVIKQFALTTMSIALLTVVAGFMFKSVLSGTTQDKEPPESPHHHLYDDSNGQPYAGDVKTTCAIVAGAAMDAKTARENGYTQDQAIDYTAKDIVMVGASHEFAVLAARNEVDLAYGDSGTGMSPNALRQQALDSCMDEYDSN